jgi:solute carrier family 25 folate transporter 32
MATLLLHPLDLIKTRFHVQEHGSKRLPHYSGMVDAVRTIIKIEGFRGLYGGLGPNIVGNTASWGVYMLAYNRCKDKLQERGYSGSPLYVSAASVAGVLTTLLLHPVFTLKTRMQLQLNAKSSNLPSTLLPAAQRDNYAGSLNAIRRMVQEEGIVSLYRGIGPSILLVSHGSIQFLTYEQLKNLLLQRRKSIDGEEELNANDLFVASTTSKICAILATYPYQVVRSCVQQRQVIGDDAVRYTSAGATVKHIWRLEGAGGFYRGIWAHMLRSTPQATITLMLYEYFNRALAMMRQPYT